MNAYRVTAYLGIAVSTFFAAPAHGANAGDHVAALAAPRPSPGRMLPQTTGLFSSRTPVPLGQVNIDTKSKGTNFRVRTRTIDGVRLPVAKLPDGAQPTKDLMSSLWGGTEPSTGFVRTAVLLAPTRLNSLGTTFKPRLVRASNAMQTPVPLKPDESQWSPAWVRGPDGESHEVSVRATMTCLNCSSSDSRSRPTPIERPTREGGIAFFDSGYSTQKNATRSWMTGRRNDWFAHRVAFVQMGDEVFRIDETQLDEH
jgi:hypothetical protein